MHDRPGQREHRRARTNEREVTNAAKLEAFFGRFVDERRDRDIGVDDVVAARIAHSERQCGLAVDDTDAEDWTNADRKAGNLDLVHKTLDGIAAQSRDDGAKGFGRHAATGRSSSGFKCRWLGASVSTKTGIYK